MKWNFVFKFKKRIKENCVIVCSKVSEHDSEFVERNYSAYNYSFYEENSWCEYVKKAFFVTKIIRLYEDDKTVVTVETDRGRLSLAPKAKIIVF